MAGGGGQTWAAEVYLGWTQGLLEQDASEGPRLASETGAWQAGGEGRRLGGGLASDNTMNGF
jgi:hypothetical protein